MYILHLRIGVYRRSHCDAHWHLKYFTRHTYTCTRMLLQLTCMHTPRQFLQFSIPSHWCILSTQVWTRLTSRCFLYNKLFKVLSQAYNVHTCRHCVMLQHPEDCTANMVSWLSSHILKKYMWLCCWVAPERMRFAQKIACTTPCFAHPNLPHHMSSLKEKHPLLCPVSQGKRTVHCSAMFLHDLSVPSKPLVGTCMKP